MMSFSGEVKRELAGRVGRGRHCKIAELAAMIVFDEKHSAAEHDGQNAKYETLVEQLSPEKNMQKIYEMVKMWDGTSFVPSDTVSGLLIQQTCCKRAYIRGAFLSAGSISDTTKSYHFEIVCRTMPQAVQLREVMGSFDLDAKIVERKKYRVVYLKEVSGIVDILNVMEAHTALMNLENVRILKEMRNSVNRKVNFETANITKTVNAAVRQVEDIRYITEHAGIAVLPENLREIALLRLEYPEASLKELGARLSVPVGKSGVNHRLHRIGEIAEELRGK